MVAALLIPALFFAAVEIVLRVAGTGYPTAFLEELHQHQAVLLTNLGDEQPRLIFDVDLGCAAWRRGNADQLELAQ